MIQRNGDERLYCRASATENSTLIPVTSLIAGGPLRPLMVGDRCRPSVLLYFAFKCPISGWCNQQSGRVALPATRPVQLQTPRTPWGDMGYYPAGASISIGSLKFEKSIC